MKYQNMSKQSNGCSKTTPFLTRLNKDFSLRAETNNSSNELGQDRHETFPQAGRFIWPLSPRSTQTQ